MVLQSLRLRLERRVAPVQNARRRKRDSRKEIICRVPHSLSRILKLPTMVIPVLIFLTAANSLWTPKAFGQSTVDKRTPVSVIYEAVAVTNATLWLMEDARLFEKYGLNAKVIHARGAVPVQALMSNTVEFGASADPPQLLRFWRAGDLVLSQLKATSRSCLFGFVKTRRSRPSPV